MGEQDVQNHFAYNVSNLIGGGMGQSQEGIKVEQKKLYNTAVTTTATDKLDKVEKWEPLQRPYPTTQDWTEDGWGERRD